MKVLCPKHEDSVPSCEVYPDHGYCFVCQATIPLSELGVAGEQAPKERFTENLAERRAYIDTLPKEVVRGLLMPVDKQGYYITWPDGLYYKRRNWSGEPRYSNPSGHTQPLFWVRRTQGTCLYVVEGEINALSIAEVLSRVDVMSPGSAPEFNARKQDRHLTLYTKYSNVVIVTDKDPAGTVAAIQLKSLLLGKVPRIDLVLMEKDANQILVEDGKDKLREEIYRNQM